MIATMIGFILLALHLSSQVAANNATTAAMPTTTMNGTMAYTVNGTDSVNGTRGPTGASVSVHANTFTVLVSVALAASSLLHSRV